MTNPPDSPRQLIHRLASHVGLTILDLGLTGEDFAQTVTSTAAFPEAKLRIVLTVHQDDGPARLHLNQAGQRVFPQEVRYEPAEPLREVESCAIEAAPRHDEAPVSVKRLAQLAGYSYTAYFREAVNQLLDRGVLVKVRGKVKRGSAD